MSPVKETNVQENLLIQLGQVLHTLREAESSDDLMEATLNYLRSAFLKNYELIWIGLYDRMEHRMLGKGGFTPGGAKGNGIHNSEMKQKISLLSGDILEQVVIQQRPLALADLRQEIRAGDWRKVAQKHNIQGTMLFPLCFRDRCLGVLILGTHRWGTFPGTTEKATLDMVLGELASVLNQTEQDWQRKQIKRPDKPLLQQLDRTRSLPDLGKRLEVVIEETHQFLAPTRTSLYWFEPNQRYFWRRLTNQMPRMNGLLENNPPAGGITAQEINSFYQQLVNDQVVAIGESHSSLRADATSRLMKLIRARSLLAAPILYQNQLLGFLAVEGSAPRIWQDEEKLYLRGAAQIVALMSPLEEMETIIEQTKLDQALTTEIARSLYSSDDWKTTLNRAAELLGKRLKIERFMVVLRDARSGHFEVCYQHQPRNRRATGVALPKLSDLDLQLAERSEASIAIENLEDDLRFTAWRSPLWELGVRSFLLASTSPGHRLESILLVCHETPRSWTAAEQQLVQIVAQQLGVILNQWQLQRQVTQEAERHQSTQRCIQMIQQCDHLEDLEQVALRTIAPILGSPMAFLVSWFPGRRTGRLVLPQHMDRRYALLPNTKVSIHADPLIRMIRDQNTIRTLTPAQIPGESRQWLNAQGMTQIVTIALRICPDDEPTGLFCLVFHDEQVLDDRSLHILSILTSQLAAARRHLKLEATLQSERLKLEQIGWYKHRHLEELHRSVNVGIQRLIEAAKPVTQDALTTTRNQQILRQLGEAMVPVQSALLNEQWQLQFRQESLPLLGLLRRALDRAEYLLKQRQLWSQVHQDSNPIIIGDSSKLEMILYEVILTSGLRSESGKRIDIWCRQFDERWVEIAITDNGTIEPRLLKDLEGGQLLDPLAPSLLNQPPGLHLAICKELLRAMGAELTVCRLEDGRIMTRLMLPAAQQGRVSHPGSSTHSATNSV
ncbi:MAG: GAF domain-containing protein [Alkalinema sp. FL-bin-369]|nr:GAF domain-containing protein [Leptolyngbyaceae cyanobacterium LF-bin-369]